MEEDKQHKETSQGHLTFIERLTDGVACGWAGGVRGKISWAAKTLIVIGEMCLARYRRP